MGIQINITMKEIKMKGFNSQWKLNGRIIRNRCSIRLFRERMVVESMVQIFPNVEAADSLESDRHFLGAQTEDAANHVRSQQDTCLHV